MKNIELIGFISEYNPEIANAMPYESYFKGDTTKEKYRSKVLAYLKDATPLASTMRGIKDLVSGEFIGSDACWTDGKWIWPDYMLYYLENKPNYVIEDRFIQFLIDNEFTYDKNKINENKLNFLLSQHIDGWWFAFKTHYLRFPNIGFILKMKFRKWFR